MIQHIYFCIKKKKYVQYNKFVFSRTNHINKLNIKFKIKDIIFFSVFNLYIIFFKKGNSISNEL